MNLKVAKKKFRFYVDEAHQHGQSLEITYEWHKRDACTTSL